MAEQSAIQLSFFPEDNIQETAAADAVNVAWSYSKRSVLEQCARRYYYEYYAAKKTTALQEVDKPMIQFLNRLENVYQRAGSILHLVIRTYFNKAKNGESWNTERLMSWAQSMFDKDQVHSRQHPDDIESDEM